jgi:hypothetical protein
MMDEFKFNLQGKQWHRARKAVPCKLVLALADLLPPPPLPPVSKPFRAPMFRVPLCSASEEERSEDKLRHSLTSDLGSPVE